MDPTIKAVIWTIAFVIFLLVAVVERVPRPVNVALGLTFFTLPFVWDAWEAA